MNSIKLIEISIISLWTFSFLTDFERFFVGLRCFHRYILIIYSIIYQNFMTLNPYWYLADVENPFVMNRNYQRLAYVLVVSMSSL